MDSKNRKIRYINARNLAGRWKLLSEQRKGYAKYLVKRYGCPVRVAIQTAYCFGYDPFPYDYRIGKCVVEKHEPEYFGLS